MTMRVPSFIPPGSTEYKVFKALVLNDNAALLEVNLLIKDGKISQNDYHQAKRIALAYKAGYNDSLNVAIAKGNRI